MTFLEKAKKDGQVINEFNLMHTCCPYQLGLEKETCNGDKTNEQCEECWNREMPNTEPKVEVMPQEIISASQNGWADGYSKGLSEGILFARKITSNNYETNLKIFGKHEDLTELISIENYEKLKAYEEPQEEIKIGDVVVHLGTKGVVIDFVDSTDDEMIVLNENGCVETWDTHNSKKTGKHIDIQSILEQIGE